jgi:cytochrome c biogenesis protein CcmG/thiol:disulfide interchange protein DsbE
MTDSAAPSRAPLGRRLLLLLPAAVFALVAAYLGAGLMHDPRKIPSALIDKPVPGFDLPPLLADRPALKTDDLKGEVQLVNMFASWCVPCRIEHPMLMRIAREGKIPLHGISWKDKKEASTQFLAELGNPFRRIGHDESGRVGIDWGVYGVPESYLIDRDGRIRYKVVGPLTPEELRDNVLPLVERLRR